MKESRKNRKKNIDIFKRQFLSALLAFVLFLSVVPYENLCPAFWVKAVEGQTVLTDMLVPLVKQNLGSAARYSELTEDVISETFKAQNGNKAKWSTVNLYDFMTALGDKIKDEITYTVKEGEEENSGRLLLMNSQAAVFACKDIYKTSVFYEDKLGFKAAHLDDEAMPHIKLVRDNIAIVLVKGSGDITKPARNFGIKYDMYIYCSEPFLLHNEVAGNGIKIVEDLPEAKAAQSMTTNRQFVFEDIDGRHICVSQYIESN